MEADIGLIGLAVMGQNLVLNMNDHGYRVAVFNRSILKTEGFLGGIAKNSKVVGAADLKEFFSLLKRPRKVLFMVQAGKAVDELIEQSLHFLERGDIVIDGGNSHFLDTENREKRLRERGILFVGAGFSGGEEGARRGPSIMPGGNYEAWPLLQPIFQTIAAKAEDGTPCCGWVGEGGAGHYVKMVHNGIEYGDMQLICEVFHILRDLLFCSMEEMASVFAEWNKGELNGFLMEITAAIFRVRDKNQTFLLENILDVVHQKGTGKWTSISALDLGVPVTVMAESVFARDLSALKEERMVVSDLYPSKKEGVVDKALFCDYLRSALYGAKIVNYAQGFSLMQSGAKKMGWNLHLGNVALLWRGGCIIRSRFLEDIQKAFVKNKDLSILLLDPFFASEIKKALNGWREVVSLGVLSGIPVPALASGLAFFDGYRCKSLPANLVSAQRDFFGAHGYERIDTARGSFFHTKWQTDR
jgi:6-phosphogluconate dehydrogenase